MKEEEKLEWARRMVVAPNRVPLEEVADWWLDMWEWRTAELDSGRGNPYDFHPSYRAPWSMVMSKFPWLNVDDRIDIAPIIEGKMKKRVRRNPAMRAWYQEYRKEKREF